MIFRRKPAPQPLPERVGVYEGLYTKLRAEIRALAEPHMQISQGASGSQDFWCVKCARRWPCELARWELAQWGIRDPLPLRLEERPTAVPTQPTEGTK